VRTDLQAIAGHPSRRGQGGTALITRGADLVYLTEELYLRLFILTLSLTVVGAAVSIWFGVVSSHAPLPLTLAIAAVAVLLATVGLRRPRRAYLWLRFSRLRQVSPAVIGIIAVLINGPDSPSWWIALPLLWVIAAVSSTGLSFTAAAATAGAYLAGTALGGEAVVRHGNAEILAAAVALPANILIGRLVAEVFARFVLRLHELESRVAPPARPIRVTVTPAGAATEDGPTPHAKSAKRRPGRGFMGLTSRELEVVLLVRDGLIQPEIAPALGISTRQVERLLASARERTDSATTSQLVAKLVSEHLVP
jgi:DNA-binding CsgD family transcriptional regulator